MKTKNETKDFLELRKLYYLGNEWLYLTIANRTYDLDKKRWFGWMVIFGSVKLFNIQIVFKIG